MWQPRTDNAPDNATAALAYARRGWAVFPCHPQERTPLTPHGLYNASIDEEQIVSWWRRWPKANVAIATGDKSKLLVVDVNPRNGGDITLKLLEAERGSLPETVESRTGGGGRHLLFSYPG